MVILPMIIRTFIEASESIVIQLDGPTLLIHRRNGGERSGQGGRMAPWF